MMADTLRLSRRLVRAQLKRPFYIVMAVSQPLIYLLFFGAMFSKMPQPALGGTSYFAYLTPGMTIMAALFGSAYLSAGTLSDAERSLFDSILISPVSRWSISLSYVCANLVSVGLQMATIIVFGVVIGGYPAGGLVGIGALFAVGMLTGVAFGCVSNTAGFIVKRAQHVLSAMNFVVMPLMFMSGMMLTIQSMPAWMQQAALFNPVHWAVMAGQGAYAGHWSGAALIALSGLCAFTLCIGVSMHWTFMRFLAQR